MPKVISLQIDFIIIIIKILFRIYVDISHKPYKHISHINQMNLNLESEFEFCETQMISFNISIYTLSRFT